MNLTDLYNEVFENNELNKLSSDIEFDSLEELEQFEKLAELEEALSDFEEDDLDKLAEVIVEQDELEKEAQSFVELGRIYARQMFE